MPKTKDAEMLFRLESHFSLAKSLKASEGISFKREESCYQNSLITTGSMQHLAALFLIHFLIYAAATPNFLKEPSSASAVKGGKVTFDCQIDASQPGYNWLKDGRNVSKGSISLVGSLSSLTLSNLEFSDAGNYSCVATDKQSGESGERTGVLTVEGKPSIIQAPSVLSTYVGQSGIFHCVVVGDPKPTVRWKNSSNAIINAGGRFELFSNNTLKISNLLKSDDGSFFICEADNSYGTTVASTTLRVTDPPTLPSFTSTPVNQTAKEGERVTFYCSATGSPSPTITWSKLGGIIPAGRHQEPSPGSLRIINLHPDDDGTYVCTAQNILGNVTALAFLRIQGYPRFLTGPSDKVVAENSSVQFTCIIEGDPVPRVEWTTPNGTIIARLSQASGAIRVLANNSLSIAIVTVMDAGTYTCTVVNSIGRRSSSATLTVLASPRFSTHLTNRTQNINSHLAVECTANAAPSPDYQWLFNGSIVSKRRSLNKSSISLADEGLYVCIANNSLGAVQDSFYLTVQVPPMFIESPKNQTVPKGQTASFPCSASGNPVPSITWYKSSTVIVNNARYSILANHTLVVNSVIEQDSALLTCRAVNEAGTREAKAYLLVAEFPVFTTLPSNATVEEGHTVTLTCRARGPDMPIITWMKEDDDGNSINIVPGFDTRVDPSGDLKYTNTKSKNKGMHICKACNTAGCKMAKAFLDVLFAPRFPVPPGPVFVLKGQTAQLECKPESNPPAVITWLRAGQSLPRTGQQYIVNDVQPADEGPYTCNAKNSRGSTQGTVQLSIGTKAEITDFKQIPSANKKVLLKCIVRGMPSPEVTWYLQNSKLPQKPNFPDYDVTASSELLLPAAALGNISFLCNCTNPLDSVAKFARVPEAPTQVTVTKIMETSLHVTWSQSSPLDFVLQYMVEVKAATGDWKQVNDTIVGTSVLVNELNSFTAYLFRVRSKNGLGISPYSQLSQNVTTLEGAPSAPRDLELMAKNASVIVMSWNKPAVLNGHLNNLQYRVNYIPQDGNVSNDSFIQHSSSGDPQNLTLVGLLPDTVYIVRVFAGRRRTDGVERWSGHVSKTAKTWQLVPLTPPVDLTVMSNGAYQIMVKWKIPPYSIAGYDIWHKEYQSAATYEQVRLNSMSHIGHLILHLKPDTKYEVKARMYSNAGIGPFSEPQVVKTSIDALAVSSRLSNDEESSGLQVAIICFVIGFLLLLIITAFVCFKRRQSKRARQSFRIDNLREEPCEKYAVRDRVESNTSRGSTSNDSDGSVEGIYNFAVEDKAIDERMFAGDRNSTGLAHVHDLGLRYLDPASLNHDVSFTSEGEGDFVRLEKFQPRGSPAASRKNRNTVYAVADVSHTGGRGSEQTNTGTRDLENAQADESYKSAKKQNRDLTTVSSVSSEESSSDDEDDEPPPSWIPPRPPVKYDPSEHSQGDNDRKDWIAVPDNSMNETSEKSSRGRVTNAQTTNETSSSKNDNVIGSLTARGNECPLYAQVDPLKKKNKTDAPESRDRTENGITSGSYSDTDTSDDDSVPFPPPPPPPQNLSNLPDDSDWERPLPPDIMALPGKRNRFASWADDESDNVNGYENLTKI